MAISFKNRFGKVVRQQSCAFDACGMAALGMAFTLLAGCGGGAVSLAPITPITSHISWAAPIAITYPAALGATQLDATANAAGTFAYTPALGTVLAPGPQALSVTFTPADPQHYTTAIAHVTQSVNQATPVLTWAPPPAITYGAAIGPNQLNTTANIAGTFGYTPGPGTIVGSGSQILSVTFTPVDGKNYTTATADVTLPVNPATPLLGWLPPAAITYGTALSATQLNATANLAGTFAYTPALGKIPEPGTQALSVTFTPTDAKNYSTATANVSLLVSQAAPVLSWLPPAAITYGTALSPTQLNATAKVPGTFVYTPAVGTNLSIGSQMLSAAFTPSDTRDYTMATVSVMLTVNQVTPVLTWATPAAIIYGAVLSAAQLNSTANVAGTFAYNPAPGVMLDAGSQMLSVTFTPSDGVNNATATASVGLLVNQATPMLKWAIPQPIVTGEPLRTTQLNAVATAPGSTTPVDGSYLYSPDAGTRFTLSGAQALHVTFTPSDATDYTSAEASVTQNVQPLGVVAWGDSLTGDFPADLAKLIYLPVVNQAISGQTSTQIGVRQGGVPTYATVSGGVIPGAGGVTVTFPPSYEPTPPPGTAGVISGTILGVHGTVTLAKGIYTFTPSTPGNPVNAPGAPRFVVDTPYANYIPIFWEGRNNYAPATQVLSDLAAQVGTLSSGQNYLVLSVLNFNYAWEQKGDANHGYRDLVALGTQEASIYGTHYLDIRKVLVDHYDPTLITDVSDYSHDEPPTSLRGVTGTGTLGSAIGSEETSLTVNLKTGYLVRGSILTIDTGANAENVFVSSVAGNTVTVLRNLGGLDTSHSFGVAVTQTDKLHLGPKGWQVVANAVAEYLSIYQNPAP